MKRKVLIKHKVLQGFIDVAGQASRYARGLRMKGYVSESWLYERVLRDEPFDRELNFEPNGLFSGRLRKFKYFIEAACKFNIWHIHKGFSMFNNATDLAIAKSLGISIVIHYRGREIRPIMETLRLSKAIADKVKREAEIASVVLVKDGQLAEMLSPYVKNVKVFPNIVDISDYDPPSDYPIDFFDEKRKLRVLHIASNPKYKGTELIRKQIEKIKDRIHFTELNGMNHENLLEQYWNADIVIDQMAAGTYGNASLEAMALRRTVINYLEPAFLRYEPEIPPIIHAAKDRLAETIISIDENREIHFESALRGKIFTDKYHSYSSVGDKLIECYDSMSARVN